MTVSFDSPPRDAIPPFLRGNPRAGWRTLWPFLLAFATIAFACSVVYWWLHRPWPTFLDVHAMARSPDGKRVAVALEAHTAPIFAIALFGEGSLAPVSELQYVRVVDLEHLSAVATPLVHRSTIWNAAFAPDVDLLASASDDPVDSVKLWDPADGNALASISLSPDTACAVAFSPDGKRLAVSPCEGTSVRVFDAHTRELQGKLTLETPFSHDFLLAFLADSRHVIAVHAHRGTELLDAENPAEHVRIGCEERPYWSDFVVSPRRKYLLMTCAGQESDMRTQLWDLEERRMIASFPDTYYQIVLAEHSMALGSHGAIDVLSVPEAKPLHRFESYGPGIVGLGIAFSPDERLLATTAGGESTKVRLWDVADERLLWESDANKHGFAKLVFDGSGKRLVAAGDGTFLPPHVAPAAYLKVFDVATGREVFSMAHDRRDEKEKTSHRFERYR